MAEIGSLPTPGQKPWNLNPAITAINSELEGRLSDENLNATVGAVAGAEIADRAAGIGAALSDFIARADAYEQDVRMLIISDSTAAASDSWVYQSIPHLAARFPRHNIAVRAWSDGANAYGAETVTAGSPGTRKITIDNGSVAGKNFGYQTAASRWPTLIAAQEYDVIVISHGHNDNPAALNTNMSAPQRGRLLGYLGFLETVQPSARIVLMSQNPMTAPVLYPNAAQFRADMLRRVALERGYGFIDVTKAFTEANNNAALISSDGTHPTAAGYALWAARFAKEFPKDPGLLTTQKQAPMFSLKGYNLMPDPLWKEFSGTLPSGWNVQNVTVARDATNVELSAGALSLTKTAAGQSAYAQRNIPLPIETLRGRWVTAVARVKRTVNGGLPQISIIGATAGGSEGIPNENEFVWLIASARIPVGLTSVPVRITVDGTTGSALGTIVVDRWGVFFGSLPYDPAA